MTPTQALRLPPSTAIVGVAQRVSPWVARATAPLALASRLLALGVPAGCAVAPGNPVSFALTRLTADR